MATLQVNLKNVRAVKASLNAAADALDSANREIARLRTELEHSRAQWVRACNDRDEMIKLAHKLSDSINDLTGER